MKTHIFTSAIILICSITSQAGNYSLTIDGKSIDVDLNQPTEFQTNDGNTLNIVLKKKEFIRFESDFFSMSHKSSLNPVKSSLGDGITQTMMISALGSGLLVQEYRGIDPSDVIDIMIEEVTKEEVRAGFKKNVEPIEKKVGDRVLKGKKVVTTYKDEEWTRCVYASGDENAGVLIVSMIEKEESESEAYNISDFWRTLELKE